jgi:hypothetical protein
MNPERPRTCLRFKGHWWVIVYPDGDCYRELIDNEEAAEFMLQCLSKRCPDAKLLRVRLMSAVRPPGKTNKPKIKL